MDVAQDLEGPAPASRDGKYDDLLCTPMDTGAEGEAFERVSLPYENKGQRFVITGPRSFQRQYAQLYFMRLATLEARVRQQAEAKWPGVPVVKTLGVGEDQDVVVVGTLYKQQRLRSNVLDELDLMECTLRWRHLAPTAPDTLTCYPFVSSDPFVLEECPHAYVVGNQPEFATRVITDPTGGQTVRLVAVPSFAATGSIVLLNLRTLQCQLMHFGAYRGAAAASAH
ncbi:DNA polymerase delta small subunit [Raphidocelis subcapitata]|uniref:DNA polymerase delta small subunit n=1 Tax=Raphidocelis subcapitata TaxID=307507 RepID=A0A2V0NV40_9CHLO|nr:DNA polymerase delta small subunit [Raphidocelis subcapitata]|eukprot:GBF91209.1 DNA polymerase delta small subunit [Raphidocelis subcapitata]